MAGDEHGPALVGQAADQAAQPVDALGVEAVGRLVEDQDLGVAEQGGGQPEALAHAEREAPDPAAAGGGQPGLLQDLVDPPRVEPGRGGQDPEVVAGRAARVEPARLQDRPDPAGRVGQLAVGPAGDGGRAGGRGDQAEEHPQGGRLAGAVGAEEAHDRPGVDLEVELVDGEHVAEALGEALDADGRHGVPPWDVVTPTTLRAAMAAVVGLAAALPGRPGGGGRPVRRPRGAARVRLSRG